LRQWKPLIVGCTLLALSITTLASAESYIVKNGQAQAQIVITQNPPRMTAFAAGELQALVEKITGAKLPIVTESNAQLPVRIYIGTSSYTRELGLTVDDLKHDAYRIASGDNWLALIGDDTDFVPKEPWGRNKADRQRVMDAFDQITGEQFYNYMSYRVFRSYNNETGLWASDGRGSTNAVYAFLRNLGARWYFPGELGEVLPDIDTIALPQTNQTVHPDFPMRRIRQTYQEFFQAELDEIKWQLRLGLNRAHHITGWGPPGHGIDFVHRRDEVKQAHPEYYAIWGGKRMTDHAGKPCLSHEGLFQANVKYLRAMFDTYDEPMMNVSPADGYSQLCQCELCVGKDDKERGWNGVLSDYVWTYFDRVARELYKSHPDKKIFGLAYTAYQQPPKNIDQFSPNVVIMICRWRSNFHDPETHKKFLALRKAWLEKLPSGKLMIWDYYLHCRRNGAWLGIPVYFPRIIAEDLQSLKGISLGEFASARRNWPDWNMPWHALAANHLNLYVTARYYWDADQSLEPLLDEYYSKFYGPAAKEMKAFVDYAEQHWMNASKDLGILDRYVELIEAARSAAGDSIYGQRVDLLVEYMKPLKQRREQLSKGREDVPRVRCYRRNAGDITMDGKLDDPFWKNITAHPLRELETGRNPAHSSNFKLGWAGDDLYIGIVCHDNDMANLGVSTTRNDDGNMWNGDNIEVLLETQGHSYYQIAVNPAGAVYDLDRKKGLVMRWQSEAQIATHVADDHWSVELRIPVAGDGHDVLMPFSGVSGRRPTQTHPWFFNIARQRVRDGQMERSAFSPTSTQSFHRVLKFAEMYVR